MAVKLFKVRVEESWSVCNYVPRSWLSHRRQMLYNKIFTSEGGASVTADLRYLSNVQRTVGMYSSPRPVAAPKAIGQ